LNWLHRAGIDTALVFGLAVLWLLASNAFRYRGPGKSMETLGAEVLIVSYAGLLLGLTARLRWVAGEEVGALGYYVLGSLIVAAKCGDIGAYTFGRLFGRRKMAPLLSPGKTWAGFVGALLVAGLASYLWLQFACNLFNVNCYHGSVIVCLIY